MHATPTLLCSELQVFPWTFEMDRVVRCAIKLNVDVAARGVRLYTTNAYHTNKSAYRGPGLNSCSKHPESATPVPRFVGREHRWIMTTSSSQEKTKSCDKLFVHIFVLSSPKIFASRIYKNTLPANADITDFPRGFALCSQQLS